MTWTQRAYQSKSDKPIFNPLNISVKGDQRNNSCPELGPSQHQTNMTDAPIFLQAWVRIVKQPPSMVFGIDWISWVKHSHWNKHVQSSFCWKRGWITFIKNLFGIDELGKLTKEDKCHSIQLLMEETIWTSWWVVYPIIFKLKNTCQAV